jgi:hypothetical protein
MSYATMRLCAWFCWNQSHYSFVAVLFFYFIYVSRLTWWSKTVYSLFCPIKPHALSICRVNTPWSLELVSVIICKHTRTAWCIFNDSCVSRPPLHVTVLTSPCTHNVLEGTVLLAMVGSWDGRLRSLVRFTANPTTVNSPDFHSHEAIPFLRVTSSVLRVTSSVFPSSSVTVVLVFSDLYCL